MKTKRNYKPKPSRLIDNLSESSLSVLSKFGHIHEDQRTGTRYIRPYKNKLAKI